MESYRGRVVVITGSATGIVSHAYNKVRLDERHNRLASAFAKHAPRYEGDDEFDVRTQMAKMMD